MGYENGYEDGCEYKFVHEGAYVVVFAFECKVGLNAWNLKSEHLFAFKPKLACMQVGLRH